MKIGFDVSQTGAGKAGCGYFAEGLIRALERLADGHEYFLYPAFGDVFWDPQCATATYSTNHPGFARMQAPASFEESQRLWRNSQRARDFEARIGSPDLVHSNNFFCPRGLARARLVYTLHDLSFLVDPSWSTEPNRVGCLDGVFRAATSADWIVANSDYTRRHFLEVFPHYPAERTAVVYPASRYGAHFEAPSGAPSGPDRAAPPRPEQSYAGPDGPAPPRPERFGQLKPESFWLSVGSLEPRKNQRRLVEAYLRGGSRLPLILAGGPGWLMEDFARRPPPGVVLAGYVSDAELEWLYCNCFGFLYPSLFEGFGMPVLEALSLGAPVICSNTTSLPEVAGDAALLVDPLDVEALAAAMLQLEEKPVRERLRTLGARQAQRFSWEASARKLLAIYEECLRRERWTR
jgi:glycosyltransferase involved in cell wall biosynthesis